MTVNAVGIAQVSHICKLAVSGMEKSGCEGGAGDTHACCPSEADNQSQSQDEDCCTNVIKYYHQKVNTTLQQVYKVQPLNLYISLFVVSVPVLGETEFTSFYGDVDFPIGKTGKTIIIDIQSLLI